MTDLEAGIVKLVHREFRHEGSGVGIAVLEAGWMEWKRDSRERMRVRKGKIAVLVTTVCHDVI